MYTSLLQLFLFFLSLSAILIQVLQQLIQKYPPYFITLLLAMFWCFLCKFFSLPHPPSLSLFLSLQICSSLMSFPTFKSSFSLFLSLQIFVQILCHFPLLNPVQLKSVSLDFLYDSLTTHTISASGGDNLRGFPSAISIAVMPKDQRSLYNKNKNQVKLLILHINKQHRVIFLQLVLFQYEIYNY